MAPYVEVPLPALPKEEWKAVPWAAIRARLQAMVTELTDVLDGSDVRFHNKEVEERTWDPRYYGWDKKPAMEEKNALDDYIRAVREVVASLQSALDKCDQGILEQLVIALEHSLSMLNFPRVG